MKRRVLAVVWFAAACGGSGSASVDAPTATHFITYMFNSTAYAGSSLANATVRPNSAGGNSLGIEAADSGGDVLVIAVQPATPQAKIASGMFVTGSTPPFATFGFVRGSAGTWEASGTTGSGTIEITMVTATDIQGTFSATMSGSGSSPGSGPGALTSGKFDLAIP
jgi:hypothetical protein